MKPVIDVHEHIFRGADIPLEGYLRSRAYPWWLKPLVPLLSRVLANSIRRSALGGTIHPIGRLLTDLVLLILGQGYREWARVLSRPSLREVADELVKTFAADNVDLFVPLMVDYEYWFPNTQDVPLDAQVQDVFQSVVKPYAGRIHPFVPFDPAREIAFRNGLPGPDGTFGPRPVEFSSLGLVRDAIQTKGFIGVKVYNSLGYRPTGNERVNHRQRWLFRYNSMAPYAAFDGEEFDEVLEDLYAFCEREQVPITAHCVSDGVEAYPHWSYYFCAPGYWRAVLQRHGELRLNLAHFGWTNGERFLDHRRGRLTWSREIFDMLREFPNLYTDVAHHMIMDPQEYPLFPANYAAMQIESAGLIQKRLLFGVDWHVILRTGFAAGFKQKYVDMLNRSGVFSNGDVEDFLGGNALRFLGLARDQGETGNRARLARFYADNGIAPPSWF